VLRKVVDTADWKNDIEKILAVGDFLTGAPFRKDLEKEYADTKAVLVDMGMAR
jgi:tripartite-type tricarboxylate transporter receptor subunit TctC